MRITVIGCGYLGATHAASMADLGHEVLGVELDRSRLTALRDGLVPFHEPGLAELLARHVASGRLRFTDSYQQAGDFADLHFLCVGTPQLGHSMGADLTQIDGAVDRLLPYLSERALVVGKSTVPVGTAARLSARIATARPGAELAWNPEFLREGFAVEDTLHPDRLVLGVDSSRAAARLRDFYRPQLDAGTPLVETDFATAELVKVAANAFLATKISFINAIADVCEVAGGDVVDLADAIGHDVRIGRKFLGAGIGFGGGCLPKDIRAFVHRADELGVGNSLNLLREVDAVNQRRRRRAVRSAAAMLDRPLAGARICIWGAAFKPNSDDVRDSPALAVAAELHLGGAHVVVYDPQAGYRAWERLPQLTYADSPLAAAADADLVMHLTEWPQFAELGPADLDPVVRGRRLFDGRNSLDLARWRAAGWQVAGMGVRLVLGDQVAVPVEGGLRGAGLGREVDVHQAEALG